MQAQHPAQGQTRPRGAPFWLILAGAAMVLVGGILLSLSLLNNAIGYAPNTPPLIAFSIVNWLPPIGFLLASVGAFLALVGVAFRGWS